MSRDRTKEILTLHGELAALMGDERFDDGRRKGPELRSLLVAYFWAGFDRVGKRFIDGQRAVIQAAHDDVKPGRPRRWSVPR